MPEQKKAKQLLKEKNASVTFRFVAIAVIAVTLSVVAIFGVYSILKGGVQKSLESGVESLSTYSYSVFKENLTNDLEKLKEGESVDGLTFGSIGNGQVLYNGKSYPAATSADRLAEVIDKDFAFFDPRELTGDVSSGGKVMVFYNWSDGSIRHFATKSLEDVLDDVGGNAAIKVFVSITGRVIYSSVPLNEYEQALTNEEFMTIGADGASFAVNSIGLSIDGSFYGYFVTGSDCTATERQNAEILTAVILVTGGLDILLLALYLIFYRIDSRERLQLKRLNEKDSFYYFVKTDYEGNVKDGNENFKNDFKIKNLFKNIIEKPSERGLKTGDNIWVAATLADGEDHIINFTIVYDKRHYELIGNLEDRILGEGGIKADTTKESTGDLSSAMGLLQEKKQPFLLGIFHLINRSSIELMFGHEFADKYFVAVCREIKRIFPELYVLNSNEVAVLVEDDVRQTMEGLSQTMGELNKPIKVGDNLLRAETVGAFVFVDASLFEADLDYILRCAHAAYTRVITEKTNNYGVYHESQKRNFKAYFEYDYDIDVMLKNESFMMEFQPQCSLKDGKITGFEALFRIKPSLQLDIKIYDFIVYAERTGKINKLSRFILNDSFAFAKSLGHTGVTVSVNVSPIQFLQDGFVSEIIDKYKEFELSSGQVCVEITESFLITNFDSMVDKLTELRRNGIEVHLDDFGTSYSSLLYLKRLPASVIKIDKCFIDDVDKGEYNTQVVKLIISFADALGLKVIAEGVENEEQVKVLKKLGCGYIQGYYIGRSMSAEKAHAFLEDKNAKKSSDDANESDNA